MKKINVAQINIGLAGLGVVGKGVYEILTKEIELINKRSKTKIELKAVASRSLKDFVDTTKIKFYPDILELAKLPDIDVIVEVIGGEGICHELAIATLKKGKKYVTANKALLAARGFELAKLAEENNTNIAFEASVAGAIPIIKSMKEGLSANKIEEFYAILNGTCNYILTKMLNEGLDFKVVLKQAQDLGYAEADPTFDIKGIDTAHKLVLLSAIAANAKINFGDVFVEGIDEITIDDIKMAFELGYKIKLLAIFKNHDAEIFQAVYPALVPIHEKIATIDDSFNAILTKGNNANWNLHAGRGAGSRPTASGVVADIIDIANDRTSYYYGCETAQVNTPKVVGVNKRTGKYFVTISLNDGVKADENSIKKLFAQIKIEKLLQKNGFFGVVTNAIPEYEIVDTIDNFDNKIVKSAKFIRVEETNSF